MYKINTVVYKNIIFIMNTIMRTIGLILVDRPFSDMECKYITDKQYISILLIKTSFSNNNTLMIIGRIFEPERIAIHDFTGTLNQ